MSEKRFKLIKEATLQYPICENEIQLSENQIVDLLNSQSDALLSYDKLVSDLKKENEQLRQKIKHWVYVDVDNANGCMNCKYDIGSICSILDCGTHDYLDGVSECSLRYWECKDE